MTFETIEITKSFFLMGAIIATLLVAFVLIMNFVFSVNFVSFLFFLVGILIFLPLFYWSTIASGDVGRSNAKALVSNIEQKYDVDEVQLRAFDTVTRPNQTSIQKVNVKVDGTTYMFYLTQDRNTWEPTLEDPPVPGGSNAKPSITADGLLKK